MSRDTVFTIVILVILFAIVELTVVFMSISTDKLVQDEFNSFNFCMTQ